MKNLKKKGFTIVELVIVIAVIAILSAVLIPTFSSLIKKANMSADQQAVKELNNGLVIGSIEGDPKSIDDVANALNEAGYNSFESLAPISKGYNFYWLKSTNQIVLVEVETNEVAFSVKGDEVDFAAELAAGNAFNLKRAAGEVEIETSNPETAQDNLIEAVSKGQSVALSGDLNIDSEIKVLKGEDVVINLNGYTLTTSEAGGRHEYGFDNSGSLTVENGVFEARGVENRGKLIIGENVVIKALDSNGGASIWNYAGAEVVINGGTFEATAGDKANTNENDALKYEPGVINNSGKITINGGTFEALETGCYAINNTGELVINDGTFKAWRGVVACDAGSVTINGGTFHKTSIENSGQVFYVGSESASITINNAIVKLVDAEYQFADVQWSGHIFAGTLDTSVATKVILKK